MGATSVRLPAGLAQPKRLREGDVGRAGRFGVQFNRTI